MMDPAEAMPTAARGWPGAPARLREAPASSERQTTVPPATSAVHCSAAAELSGGSAGGGGVMPVGWSRQAASNSPIRATMTQRRAPDGYLAQAPARSYAALMAAYLECLQSRLPRAPGRREMCASGKPCHSTVLVTTKWVRTAREWRRYAVRTGGSIREDLDPRHILLPLATPASSARKGGGERRRRGAGARRASGLPAASGRRHVLRGPTRPGERARARGADACATREGAGSTGRPTRSRASLRCSVVGRDRGRAAPLPTAAPRPASSAYRRAIDDAASR